MQSFKLTIIFLILFSLNSLPDQSDNNSNTSNDTLTECDYIRNVCFFLDTIFLKKYTGEIKTDIEVKELRVFKLLQWITKEFEKNHVWARCGEKETFNRAIARLFVELQEGKQYHLNKKKGVITFKKYQPPKSSETICLYLEKSDGSHIGNDSIIHMNVGINKILCLSHLWILNDRSRVCNPADLLMWRNIYPLPDKIPPEMLHFRIVDLDNDEGQAEYEGQLVSFILGITDFYGNPLVKDNKIFDFINRYLIIPPWEFSHEKTGNIILKIYPFENPALGKENINSAIYSKKRDDKCNSKFGFIFSIKPE